jgi:hypothetical protein
MEPSQPTPDQYLEQLSLSQLLVTHMLDGLEKKQVPLVQEIVSDTVEQGEQDLRHLYLLLERTFLRTPKAKIESVANYADYLRFLYENRPVEIDGQLEKLVERQAKLANIYPGIFRDKKGRCPRPSFTNWLEGAPNYSELAFSKGSRKGRQSALLIVRRKDSERALEKIAYRLLCWEINEEHRNLSRKKTQKHPLIDDWFGIKIVTYTSAQAARVFGQIYTHLEDMYYHRADPRKEPIYGPRGGVTGHQQRGVDNHYQYGRNDNLIQIKVRRIDDSTYNLREIVITDVLNMLIDEMDHIKFRAEQSDTIEKLRKKRRKYRSRYNLFLERGRELLLLLPEYDVNKSSGKIEYHPEERKRILTPGRNF